MSVIQPEILEGHVLDVLRGMPSESVHCCITSSPFYGLRSYGTQLQVWGGDPDCQHEWAEQSHAISGGGYSEKSTLSGFTSPDTKGTADGSGSILHNSSFCVGCSAWLGELGSESSPELFIAHLVEVFHEVKRVLRKDGTFYANMGDSYSGSNKGVMSDGSIVGGPKQQTNKGTQIGHIQKAGVPSGMKPKDLMEIPSMLAQALRQDGWYLRSRIPWIKINALPESVEDRPTSAVEYFFMLTKSSRPYYDLDAVRLPHGSDWIGRTILSSKNNPDRNDGGNACSTGNPNGRSRRNSDWFMESLDERIEQQRQYLAHLEKIKSDGGLLADGNGDPLALIVNTHPFPGAHFATFAPRLIEPLVLASTSEKGCCPKCGAPWKRVVERVKHPDRDMEAQRKTAAETLGRKDGYVPGPSGKVDQTQTVGWQPSCYCGVGDPTPCLVMDPFSGSGTTCLVATRLGRRSIGIELRPEYAAMARERCAQLGMSLL